MAPKKAAPSPAPVRRSARLASRSPSAEPEMPIVIKRVRRKKAPSRKTPEPPKCADRWSGVEFTPLLTPARFKAYCKQRDENPSPVLRETKKHFLPLGANEGARKWRRLMAHAELAKREAAETAPPPSPPSPRIPSPVQEEPPMAAPADPSPSAATSSEKEQPRAGWFNRLSTISGYFISPFTRKRAAEEPAEETPSQKRSRVEDSASASPPAQPPQQEREEAQEQQELQERNQPQELPNSQRTPRAILTPTSPRFMPSTKNLKVPTSLSTITEFTDSRMSNFLGPAEESTPSRPPREALQSGRLQHSSQPQVPQSVPARRPATIATMRRSAQLRAARAANAGTPYTGLGMRSTIIKPRESNADTRLAKLERMRTLQKELEELEQDEDVKEMQSHRVKRVKIDHLVEIPHNRPGDPSGCFRVPEEDSDDEMEVYDDVEVRSNLFEETNAAIPEVARKATPAVPPKAIPEVPVRREQSTQDVNMGMTFNFPGVGRIPESYYVSREYQQEAGRLFGEGLAEFLVA